MIVLKILFVFLFVLVFLLLIPVRVVITYRDAFRARIYYLFFRYTFPQKHKKTEKKETPEKKGKKPRKKSAIRGIIDERGIGGFINLMKNFAGLAGRAFRTILRRSRVSRLCLLVTTAGEDDAAEAAIQCGYYSAAIYPALAFFKTLTTVHKMNVSIRPDYTAKESHVDFEIKALVLPIVVLWAAIAAFFRYISFQVKQRMKNNQGGAEQ